MGPTPAAPARRAPHGDEAQLFATYHRRLLRLVAHDVPGTAAGHRRRLRVRLARARRAPARAHERGRLAAGRRATGSCSPRPREALGLVAALPPRKRAVLSGHSYSETAARLGMSKRTVERQLLRARRAVRRAKADTNPGPLAA